MGKAERIAISVRLVIRRPVPGVMHSLQDKEGGPLDPKLSAAGEPLVFDFPLRVGPGPKVFGDQVRREGPVRRFVYVRIGRLAGDPDSPWERRMKIDIHDIPAALIDAAIQGKRLEAVIDGSGRDGTPACATVPVESWRAV